MKRLSLAIIFACFTLAVAAQEGAAFKGKRCGLRGVGGFRLDSGVYSKT